MRLVVRDMDGQSTWSYTGAMSMGAARDAECFGVVEFHRARRRINQAMRDQRTTEACARVVCDVLYEELAAGSAAGCALIRCFKLCQLGTIDPALRNAYVASGGAERSPSLPCLVLMASRGEESAWCSRHTSRRHALIPVPDRSALEGMPMMRELFRQFDVSPDSSHHSALSVETRPVRSFDVFHIEDARGNVHIPDQDAFVRPYGVRSVVGFGGPLRRGDLYAVLLFCKVPVDRQTASELRRVALDVTTRFFQFGDDAVFDSQKERE
jgi:hypothetical protein